MINEELILQLHYSGKKNSEIRKETGYSLTTITKYLKKHDLSNNYTSVINTVDKVKQLVESGYTNLEVAKLLKISPTTARKYTQQVLNQSTNSVKAKPIYNSKLTLTQEQKEVLFGSLLGDMSIEKKGNFARLSITHGGKQEDYFEHKYNIFQNIMGAKTIAARFDTRTNKNYIKCCAHSLSHSIFLEIYELFYPNSIKTITSKILNMLTPRSLAYWFMDDGNNKGYLATNCFSVEECKLIIQWFKNTHDIDLTLKLNRSQPVLYFPKKSKHKFWELTHTYFIPSMEYKILNWNP